MQITMQTKIEVTKKTEKGVRAREITRATQLLTKLL